MPPEAMPEAVREDWRGRPFGADGKPLHGIAAQSARMKAEREAAARQVTVEALGEFRALAEVMVAVLGVDVIRARVGRERALRVLRLAGIDADRVGGTWAGEEPARRQVSRQYGQDYQGDPMHDPRVTQAILIDRLPVNEISRITAEVTKEYADAAAKRAKAREDRTPTDTAIPGLAYETRGGQRVPVQRGQTTQDWWTSHPDHQAEGFGKADAQLRGAAAIPPPPAVAAAPPAKCSHPGQTGRFCMTCGERVQPPSVWTEVEFPNE